MNKSLLVLMALLISGCGNKERSLSPFDPTNTPIKATLKCELVEASNIADGLLYLGIYKDEERIIDYLNVISEEEGFFLYHRYPAEYSDFSIRFQENNLSRESLDLFYNGDKIYDCELTETTLEAAHKKYVKIKEQFRNKRLEDNQI